MGLYSGLILALRDRERKRTSLSGRRVRAAGIVDEMQHLYGLQITTLWTIAQRPFMGAMAYEVRTDGSVVEDTTIVRMDGADQFYKTMSFLHKKEHDLVALICFEELGCIEAAAQVGIAVNNATVHVRHAFDCLGEALSQMRSIKKSLQKHPADA